MATVEVQDIVVTFLKKVGADGLSNGEQSAERACGCTIEELGAYCREGADPLGCEPAFRCEKTEREEGHSLVMIGMDPRDLRWPR